MLWRLLVIVLGLWSLYYRWQRRRIYMLEKELPSSNLRSMPFIGHAYIFAGNGEDRMKAFQKIGRSTIKHGGILPYWMGNKLYVVIADPVIAAIVLKSCLDKDETTMKYLKTVLGNGSLVAPVDIWRPRRKILAPLFKIKNLNAFFPVFATQSRIMTKQLEFKAGHGDFSIWKYITTYTFDSICQTSLGIELNSQKQSDHPFLVAFDVVIELVTERLCQPWLYSDSVYKMLPRYKTFLKHKKQMLGFVDELIKLKRQELAENRLTNTETQIESHQNTFLEMMIEFSGGADGYTDVELREEILVIILAGTDTSAAGAAFTTLMLSRYPDIQEKVYQELQEVFGNSDRPITVKDLPNLKYLEAVIKETLRTYPAVPEIVREVHNDVELPSGTKLVDGVGILISFWAIHRNPKYWGEDAELFRPERFLEGPLKYPEQFMPFSYSLRNCVGTSYAMMSMKTLLSTLLRQYRILPPAGLGPQQWTAPLRVKFGIMMKDVDDYIIRLQNRK